MKIGSSNASLKLGTARARGYIPPTDLNVPPEGTYALLEPTGEWATWADKPTYAPLLGGQVFDVTDAPYNAAGDGSTNDTAAIRAAIAAAKAWSEANANGPVTVYIPTGNYVVWSDGPDDEMDRIIFWLTFGNLTIEGDGPTSTILNVRGWGGQDPASEMLDRGFLFSTLYTPNPIDGITIRGIRATGNAAPNDQAGNWYGDQALTGWDIQHKCLGIWGDVTNFTVYACEFDNWRGEICYSGGGPELGTLNVLNSIIRCSNASAISMGGLVTVDGCDISDCYNGTECLAMSGQGLTVTNSTIEIKRDFAYGKFGVVYLGFAAAALDVDGCTFGPTNNGAIFLSECASNVTITSNAFTDTLGVTSIYLNQYSDFDTEENTWDNWLIDGNTFHTTAGTQDSVFLFFNDPSSASNWVISNNVVTRDGESRYDKFLRTSAGADGTYTVSGNTIDEAIPVFDTAAKRPTWTSNTITGTYANGNVFANYALAADPTPFTIRPPWPGVNIYDLGTGTMTRIVQLDAADLALFPTGFPLRIVRELYNSTFSGAEIIPDASWNTLTRGYMLYTGGVLSLVKNAGGKFELVSYTPNPAEIRTLTEVPAFPPRLSAADIAFFGQLAVNLSPSGAHTFSTFSGVAIGETVTINVNGNVTLDHVPGVLEMSTGVDYVSSGTAALSATRAADGTLEVTIP